MPDAVAAGTPAFSDFIVYVDESGNHSLVDYESVFPVFVLSFCIFHKEEYVTQTVPALQRLKFRHCGHDMAVFHEREIRKTTGPFEFLTDAARRQAFMGDLNAWVESRPFSIVAVVIRKEEFSKMHPDRSNPYHAALGLGLERVDGHLRRQGVVDRCTHVVFEARGRREDDDLELEFRRFRDGRSGLELVFGRKASNSTGLQLADLTARPIGRHVMNPGQPNRAFDIIEPKLVRDASGETAGVGLTCHP